MVEKTLNCAVCGLGNKVFQKFISQSTGGAARSVSIKKDWRHKNAKVGLLISYDYPGLAFNLILCVFNW